MFCLSEAPGFPCLGEGPRFWGAVFASVFVILCYVAAALSRPHDPKAGWRFNPLVITAGVFGRASLSNLQILYFSLIVFWILVYGVLWTAALSTLSEHVLYLLGIGALGTAGAKVTSITRKRLAFENLAWMKNKNWIKEDIGRKRRPPQWVDLVNSDDAFDVFKFQNVIVTLVIGLAMFATALGESDPTGLENFEIPGSLLALLGLSQVTYIGGKAIAPPGNRDLNTKLTELRDLEKKFVAAVIDAKTPMTTSLGEAKALAGKEYNDYLVAAREAKSMVEEIVGNRIAETDIQPTLPDAA